MAEKCTVIHHRENLGKGAAIKTALKYIKQEMDGWGVIGIMDADGQHLPEDMERLLMKASSEPEALILGSRTMDKSVPWKSRMGNQITKGVFRLVTGTAVTDTQTGLRAFSAGLLQRKMQSLWESLRFFPDLTGYIRKIMRWSLQAGNLSFCCFLRKKISAIRISFQ